MMLLLPCFISEITFSHMLSTSVCLKITLISYFFCSSPPGIMFLLLTLGRSKEQELGTTMCLIQKQPCSSGGPLPSHMKKHHRSGTPSNSSVIVFNGRWLKSYLLSILASLWYYPDFCT